MYHKLSLKRKREEKTEVNPNRGVWNRLSALFMCGVPYDRNPPRRSNILTVAMPGNTSSRSQIARYTAPEDGVTILEKEFHNPTPHANRYRNRHHQTSPFRILRNALRALWKDPASVEDENMNKEANEDKVDDLLDESDEDAIPISNPPVCYHATSRVGVRLLHNVLPSPEVAEVMHCRPFSSTSETSVWSRWGPLWNPFYWILILKAVLISWYFRTRPLGVYYSEFGRTNLGGLTDQRGFLREVKRAVRLLEGEVRISQTHCGRNVEVSEMRPKSLSDEGQSTTPLNSTASLSREEDAGRSFLLSRGLRTHLVLFGCSRGATTCFYTSMKLPPHLAAYVSLIILEAPFDTLEHVIRSSSWFPSLARWFFNSFCDFRGEESEATAYTYDPKRVHLRCPIAFVISTRDSRVPNCCTQTLIHQLREKLVPYPIPAVEVLTLKHSRHSCMAVGNRQDQDAYVAFVEKLYSTYCV
ncbi:unnamed protein product [Phytomonas sp. EM1]|nr:unnamed protein product [Phytomonas sp. EM1]|eukprot:CCW63110.1 unnamed protein product [Phytomonas sp. isolate EM1]